MAAMEVNSERPTRTMEGHHVVILAAIEAEWLVPHVKWCLLDYYFTSRVRAQRNQNRVGWIAVFVHMDNSIQQDLDAAEVKILRDHAQASKACNDVGYDVQIVICSRMN